MRLSNYYTNYVIDGYTKTVEVDFNRNTYTCVAKCAPRIKQSFHKGEIWDYPAYASNIICYTDSTTFQSWISKLPIIRQTGCKNILFELHGTWKFSDFRAIIRANSNLEWKSVMFVVLEYHDDIHSDAFAELFSELESHLTVICFNSPFKKNYSNKFFFFDTSGNDRQFVIPTDFSFNLELFYESLTYNPYFNKKLHIGISGEIKNAPESEEIFGYIQQLNSFVELKEIIESAAFQKYWCVNKDICDVCQDCEFRYMCVDNRVPIERKESEWYHTTECNYNPYIAKWQGEVGYLTLAECGITSNETGFSIDHDRIASINQQLWGND